MPSQIVLGFLSGLLVCCAYYTTMSENGKKSQNWGILGYFTHLSLAVSLPFLAYRLVKAILYNRSSTNFSGKVVVITGASSGLGEALAHEFYKKGAQVVLCARRKNELERVRNDLLNTHKVGPVTYNPIVKELDLSDINALPGHVAKILEMTGHIDILINNGGISHRGTAMDTSPDVDIKIMLVNYFGAAALTKAILPDMVKRQQGHVVFMSSIQGLIALPERSAYCASKHALQAFSDSLRAEMSRHNVKVTTLSPGYVKTNLSINALTGSGSVHGQMDKNTEKGYSPEYVAQQTLTAITQYKKEMVISTLLPQIAIFLRKYIPSLYFIVMNQRAKKSQ